MPVAITMGIIGLCFVIGWAVAGGSRPQLGLLGLGFIVAAAAPLIPHPPTRYGVMGVSLLVFVLALIASIAHFRDRLAQLREEGAARERAYFEMFKAAEDRRSSEEQSSAEEPSSSPGGEAGNSS